jgi:hypothetical protein
MTERVLPAPDVIRKLLNYNPRTGLLEWRERDASFFLDGQKSASHQSVIWNAKYAGKPALTAISNGYCCGTLLNFKVRSHRVVWALMTGAWPSAEIDHKNGDRADNRWNNLREVSSCENSRNCGRSAGNTSGFTGVSFHKISGRWRAFIRHNYRQISLGYFDSPEEAYAARRSKEKELGYARRHGSDNTHSDAHTATP